MARSINIQVPEARGIQFRAVAKAKGVTMTALIENAIAQAIEDGLISTEIPGFSVEEVGDDLLQLTMPNLEIGRVNWLGADTLGALLRAAAEMASPSTYVRQAVCEEARIFQVGPKGEGMIAIGEGRGVAVLSVGHGVVLKLASATGRTDPALASVPRSIARDFGVQIQAAAARLRDKRYAALIERESAQAERAEGAAA